MDALNEYAAFLWTQLQYDWSVFTTPWILYTLVPALVYLLFFVIKWVVLLAPITVPIMTFTHGLGKALEGLGSGKQVSQKDKVKDQLEQLLKG